MFTLLEWIEGKYVKLQNQELSEIANWMSYTNRNMDFFLVEEKPK